MSCEAKTIYSVIQFYSELLPFTGCQYTNQVGSQETMRTVSDAEWPYTVVSLYCALGLIKAEVCDKQVIIIGVKAIKLTSPHTCINIILFVGKCKFYMCT